MTAEISMEAAQGAYLDCPRGPFIVPASRANVKVSLVVPTFQEVESIEDLLTGVCAVLDRETARNYEVIVVDDNSPDGTWNRAAELSQRFPAIRVIRRVGEKGLAAAVLRGYQVANGEILGTINADLQHPPEVLESLIRKLHNADIAVASRFCEGGGTGQWAPERLLLSRAAFQAGRLMLPGIFSELTDPLSGFYLFRRTVIEGIPLAPIGFKTLIEILAKGKTTRAAECPYEMRVRRNGMSKVSISSTFSYLKQLKQLQTRNDW